jgi:hypothetical protein
MNDGIHFRLVYVSCKDRNHEVRVLTVVTMKLLSSEM